MRSGAALTNDSATVLFSGWESSNVDRPGQGQGQGRGLRAGEDATAVEKDARDADAEAEADAGADAERREVKGGEVCEGNCGKKEPRLFLWTVRETRLSGDNGEPRSSHRLGPGLDEPLRLR
ncbi:uncharacterized protein PG986_007165 [Apiospora aurea]|uniref:Uncharacterized protein n=1 Tax=Apiospora aurea TaxID=335848 RepID=A0ABR1QC42_9PEZI